MMEKAFFIVLSKLRILNRRPAHIHRVYRVRVKGKAEMKNFNGLGLIHFFVSCKKITFYFNSMFDGFLRSVYGKKPAPQRLIASNLKFFKIAR